MKMSKAERHALGTAAEDRFRTWLDRCHLPHIFVEQSPFTFPEHMKGEIKRPDFLVGIPSIGTIAIDVKAKRVYQDAILIDATEHRTLAAFEVYFNISVWFASFPPDEPHTCYLFLNRNLSGLAASRSQSKSKSKSKSKAAIAVPLTLTRPADERRDFMAAVLGAISLR